MGHNFDSDIRSKKRWPRKQLWRTNSNLRSQDVDDSFAACSPRNRPRAPLSLAFDKVVNAVASAASASSGWSQAESCVGAAGAGAADVGGFLGVLASARGLGAFTSLAPAMPSNYW